MWLGTQLTQHCNHATDRKWREKNSPSFCLFCKILIPGAFKNLFRIHSMPGWTYEWKTIRIALCFHSFCENTEGVRVIIGLYTPTNNTFESAIFCLQKCKHNQKIFCSRPNIFNKNVGVNVKKKNFSELLAVLIVTRRRTTTKTSPTFEDQQDILTNLIFLFWLWFY